jgi:hypothetical protein
MMIALVLAAEISRMIDYSNYIPYMRWKMLTCSESYVDRVRIYHNPLLHVSERI